jgi:hypothetical protein
MKIELVDKIESKFYPVTKEFETLKQKNKTLKLTFETKKDLHSFRSGLGIYLKKSKSPYKIKVWTEEGLNMFINIISNEEVQNETN